MKQIKLTITAQSALAIGQKKPGGSVSEAMDYIPGTVIRGAIAKALIQVGGQPQPGDDFHKLFLDDTPAIFSNGYPAIASLGKGCYELKDDDIQVLPATALSTKNDSGFTPKKAGVFDSLIDSFCAREQGYFYQPNDLKGNAVEPMGGFYSHDGNEKYVKHSVTKRLLTRVGINRRRATAQDEILYSIEVMDEAQGKAEKREQTVYRARINISNNGLADQLLTFLQNHCKTSRLGGSASRGLGKVKVAFSLKEIGNQQADLKKRIDNFNKALEERWKHWNVLSQATSNPTEGRLFFALTLQSDAILSENWQRTMVISEAILAQALKIDKESLKLHVSHSSYGHRSGWNAAWGLPKDVELITPMGSTFLFSMPEGNPCYKVLTELEERGIGQRTEEGYGQIRVCHEFHQVMREEPV